MPADHDLDPPAMTEEERLAKRRYHAYFAFEMQRCPACEAWEDFRRTEPCPYHGTEGR